MVRLNRIYTRTGDDGTTSLGDGARLPKHHPRIASYGTIDELSAVIGVGLASGVEEPYRGWLARVQNELLDVGADLCVPGRGEERLRITEAYTRRLEALLDQVNEDLPPLESFVLPGGTLGASWLHLARTVCRRAERWVTALIELDGEDSVNPEVVRYLNRLSDLLFVLARAANGMGAGDLLWKPGGDQAE
jgi:cob(I)alamin adenosyltransferase